MGIGPVLLSLQQDEDYSPNDRNEVERQVHEVADDSLRCKFRKRFGDQFAQSCNSVTGGGGFHLTLLRNQLRLAAGDESAIKGIDQAVLDQEGLRENHGQCATFAEDEQDRCKSSEWARGEELDSDLGKVGETTNY